MTLKGVDGMEKEKTHRQPKPNTWPLPLKILLTIIVIIMAAGLAVAAGQIVVHDLIPTFWSKKGLETLQVEEHRESAPARGDLFTAIPTPTEPKPFYQTDEFIFALKFSHIHIFGMSAIFILMGGIVAFLDLSVKSRIWLIVLPFFGVMIDLTSVWFKLFIHPAFFWLHLPGGVLFGTIFAVDSVLILRQLWMPKS